MTAAAVVAVVGAVVGGVVVMVVVAVVPFGAAGREAGAIVVGSGGTWGGGGGPPPPPPPPRSPTCLRPDWIRLVNGPLGDGLKQLRIALVARGVEGMTTAGESDVAVSKVCHLAPTTPDTHQSSTYVTHPSPHMSKGGPTGRLSTASGGE